MSPEANNLSIIKLASEAAGVSTYYRVLPKLADENPSWHPAFNKAVAAVGGFCSFEMPLIVRLNDMGVKFKGFDEPRDNNKGEFARFGVVHQAIILREFVSWVTTFGVTMAVGINTGNWLLASGAHLASRFILNGAIHWEMNKYHPTI